MIVFFQKPSDIASIFQSLKHFGENLIEVRHVFKYCGGMSMRNDTPLPRALLSFIWRINAVAGNSIVDRFLFYALLIGSDNFLCVSLKYCNRLIIFYTYIIWISWSIIILWYSFIETTNFSDHWIWCLRSTEHQARRYRLRIFRLSYDGHNRQWTHIGWGHRRVLHDVFQISSSHGKIFCVSQRFQFCLYVRCCWA